MRVCCGGDRFPAEPLLSTSAWLFYFPEDEGGLIWNEPAVGIPWPFDAPQLSGKALKNPRLLALA